LAVHDVQEKAQYHSAQFICGKGLERVFIVDTEASVLVLLHSGTSLTNRCKCMLVHDVQEKAQYHSAFITNYLLKWKKEHSADNYSTIKNESEHDIEIKKFLDILHHDLFDKVHISILSIEKTKKNENN
jgi:hypothetical protein